MKSIKILLLLPSPSLNDDKKRFPTYFPYFSLTSATHLKEAGFQVEIIDYYHQYKTKNQIKEDIVNSNSDIIGVCVCEPTRYLPIETHNEFINFVHSVFRGLIFIFGIYQANILNEYLKNSFISHILYGDPENLIVYLAKELSQNENNVPRLLGYNIQNKIHPIIINNLNDILPIDYNFIKFNDYKFNPHRYKRKILYHMIISRGCPWNKCVFCEDMSLLKMPPYRYKSPDNVIYEIEKLYIKNSSFEVQFYDPQFVTDLKWLQKFYNLIKQKNLWFNWSCLSRVDMLNEEVLQLMSKAGCWNILIGIESFSQHLLSEINKGITISQINTAIKLCKKYNIEITGSFLIGLPNETPNDVINSAKKAVKIGIDYVQFFIAKYSCNNRGINCKKYKTSKYVDYSQFDFVGTPLILNNYKKLMDLKKIQKKAYRIFYTHPKTILKMLKKINSFSELKRLLKGLLVLIKIFKK